MRSVLGGMSDVQNVILKGFVEQDAVLDLSPLKAH
jgi:hypothetical protein